MNKTLAMLWLAGTLALSPKAQAGITPKTEETKKDLIEAVTTEQATSQEDGQTITFEEAQKLHEQQQLMEEIMENEKIKELINEYWQEEVERTISEILTSKDAQELMKKLLEDEKIQKALEKWDEEAVTKRVEETIEEHKEWSFWSRVGKSMPASISWIIIWIYMGKRWQD